MKFILIVLDDSLPCTDEISKFQENNLYMIFNTLSKELA